MSGLDGIGDVHDFAVGPYGRLYVLDERADVWMYDEENRHHERLFPNGHGLFGHHALLAVSGEMLLVADFDREQTVTAYSVSNSQTYWSLGDHQGMPILPLAAASDERYFYVVTPLDAIRSEQGDWTSPAGGRIGVVKFSKAGEVAAVVEDDKWRTKESISVRRLRYRYYLAVSSKQDMFVFDAAGHFLVGFPHDGQPPSRIYLPSLQFAGLAIDSRNQLYIGDSRHVDDEGEDDRFILNLGETGEWINKVPGFRGKADKLIFGDRDMMYILNAASERASISVLELQRRTLENEESGMLDGILLMPALDSREAETVWHKMQLDADIPDETQLRLSYFCSDRDSVVTNGRIVHVDTLITDPSLSVREKNRLLEDFWSEPVINPKDALFLEAKGRYMWLKLEWMGSERKSPQLNRLRVYFPRITYLSYMPAMYQQDPGGFMERFLALFGAMFESVESDIADLPRRFDSDLVSGPSLRWLGSWLGIEVDEHWTDAQIRRFIQEAPQLYRYRGTRKGIETMVEIYTGRKPQIIEYFQYKAMRESADLRALTDLLYGMNPSSFSVLVTMEQAPTEKQRLMLQRMLDDQKPAFTEARLIVLQPWMYLDMHTYLELNTVLTEPSLLTLSPDRSMPSDTLLVDVDRDRRLDSHTRLGLDSELE